MMPGGGLGIFDGCTSQFGFQFPGARYGGVSSRSECSALPAKLQAGCQWRFDWFKNADNPNLLLAMHPRCQPDSVLHVVLFLLLITLVLVGLGSFFYDEH
ncbi:putative endoglucanase type K [Colletotrichum chlorophyti]|uniref:cellulase n=1 Tax=Colletotrichum chlorophyti TaxID=708187 RepID=A0A1Q8R9Y1_9PEZI|nr:putative endoglucanase type K [Colletotrichum chlorophyti]